MKKSIILVSFIFIYSLYYSTIAFSQNWSINFEKGTWKEIMEKAQAEKKIIFLYAHWDKGFVDDPILKNTFTNDQVADFYNKHFICYDADLNSGDGPLLEAKYKVMSSCAFFFLDERGDILHRDYDPKNESAFITLGKTALNPETRFEAWRNKYMEGHREPAFIRLYIKMLWHGENEIKEMADWYFASQKNEDLLTKENFEMIRKYLEEEISPAFQYLVANRSKFRELFGADKVDNKIFNIYHSNIQSCHLFYTPDGKNTVRVDEEKFNHLKEAIKQSGFERSEELLMFADVWYYGEKRDGKRYAEAAIPYINKYRINDYKDLNYNAWYFYAQGDITDTALLNQALAWAKKCVDNQPSAITYDTYASLLYKLKKKNDALKAIQTSIDMKKKAGEDIRNSQYLLDKIMAMK